MISGPWRSFDPRLSSDFLHGCEIKSGRGLGTRLASDQISQRFPAPLYLHTRNNQILEVTKAFASSVFHTWQGWGCKGLWTKAKLFIPCVNYAQRYPWNAYLLHLCVLTTYMLTWFHLICCVLKPCVILVCVHLLLSLTVRGEVLWGQSTNCVV